jgi:hypothetical protein
MIFLYFDFFNILVTNLQRKIFFAEEIASENFFSSVKFAFLICLPARLPDFVHNAGVTLQSRDIPHTLPSPIFILYIVDSSCKKPLVICNSIFSIFLNQIKAQRDLKIIVWIEYFPCKYSFKVISND